MAFVSTDVEFLNFDKFTIGQHIDLYFQDADSVGDYGNYATFVDADTQTQMYGIGAKAIMYKITQGTIKPGDLVRIIYEGKKDSVKKGFKPFHSFKVLVDRQPIAKPVEEPKAATVEADVAATWSDFDFEEV